MTDKMVSFKSIGGYESQKAAAKRISDFFRNYDKYVSRGAELPSGILFYGMPGTGKTMLANAIANESGVPAYRLEADEAARKGNVAAAIKSLFEKAIANAPSILIVDELERVVNCDDPYRKQESDRQREALRAFLTEIDNAKGKGVLLIATSNVDISQIPSALIRAGRIGKHVWVDAPSNEDRKKIISLHLGANKCFDGISVDDLASYMPGFTGSDIASIVNEVLIACVEEGRNACFSDFLDPIEAVKFGTASQESDDADDSVIYHEIGHFVADYVLNGKIGMLDIVRHGDILGMYSTLDDPMPHAKKDEDKGSYRKSWNNCVIAVSGAIAAEEMLGEKFLGAASDYAKVANTYRALLSSGIGDSYDVAVEVMAQSFPHFPSTTRPDSFIEGFEKFLNGVTEESRRIISANKELIGVLFEPLKRKKILMKEEISDIVRQFDDGAKRKAS